MCWSLFFDIVADLKNETSAQVFSCEYCEILKNTYSEEYLRFTASETNQKPGCELRICKRSTVSLGAKQLGHLS